MAKKYPLSGGSGMRAGFPRTTLSSMDDISVDNPQPGEGLVWNGTNWENAAVPGGGSSNLTYFLTTLPGSIALYNLLDTKPENSGGGAINAPVKASTSPLSMIKFVSGELGKTVLQGGAWVFTLYGAVDIIAGATKFRIEVSSIATAGASETLLFTVDTEPVDATPVHPIEVTTIQPEIAGLLGTDKLKIEIFAVTDSATNVTLSLSYGSLATASRVISPLIINHADIPGLDYTVDGHTGHITKAANQFASIAAKAAPIRADQMIIEDSADSFKKKSVGIGDLVPWLYGTGAPPATTGLVDGTLYIKYLP